MKIYLAGGMKGDWQDKVIAANPQHEYFDPRTHGLESPKEYTRWDLEHVAMSDLVFACFTEDNPSGFGMCIEIGYAHALDIPIILVDEQQQRSWSMVNCCCASVRDNIASGVNVLSDMGN